MDTPRGPADKGTDFNYHLNRLYPQIRPAQKKK